MKEEALEKLLEPEMACKGESSFDLEQCKWTMFHLHSRRCGPLGVRWLIRRFWLSDNLQTRQAAVQAMCVVVAKHGADALEDQEKCIRVGLRLCEDGEREYTSEFGKKSKGAAAHLNGRVLLSLLGERPPPILGPPFQRLYDNMLKEMTVVTPSTVIKADPS